MISLKILKLVNGVDTPGNLREYTSDNFSLSLYGQWVHVDNAPGKPVKLHEPHWIHVGQIAFVRAVDDADMLTKAPGPKPKA